MFFDEKVESIDYEDGVCGLWIRRPDDELIQAKVPTDAMIVQVGQALEILTGGTLIATPHIVKPPQRAGVLRCGFAHFMHVDPSTILMPMEQFREENDAIERYAPPKLASTFAIATLVKIGLAPPSTLEGLSYNYASVEAARKR